MNEVRLEAVKRLGAHPRFKDTLVRPGMTLLTDRDDGSSRRAVIPEDFEPPSDGRLWYPDLDDTDTVVLLAARANELGAPQEMLGPQLPERLLSLLDRLDAKAEEAPPPLDPRESLVAAVWKKTASHLRNARFHLATESPLPEPVLGWLHAQMLSYVANRFKVALHFTNGTAFDDLVRLHRNCRGFSHAPMWTPGFICMDHRTICVPTVEFEDVADLHSTSQLLHELGHVVLQSFIEDEIAEWEVIASCLLFGCDSAQTADVLRYGRESGVSESIYREALERFDREFAEQAQAQSSADELEGEEPWTGSRRARASHREPRTANLVHRRRTT